MQLLYMIYCFLLSCLSDLLSSISRNFIQSFLSFFLGAVKLLFYFYCCSCFRPSAAKHVQHEYLCEQSTRLVYRLSLFEGQAFCRRHMSGWGCCVSWILDIYSCKKKKKKIDTQTNIAAKSNTVNHWSTREEKHFQIFFFFFNVFV